MNRQLFKFNLLPPQTEAEIIVEEERDESVVYALVLLFVSILVYFIVILVKGLVVDVRLAEYEDTLATTEQQISYFQGTQTLYGELFIKTKTLKPVLEKKIDTTAIFKVADDLVAGDPNRVVTSYSREQTGEFVFDVLTDSFAKIPQILDTAYDIEGTAEQFLRNARLFSADGIVRTTLSLTIDAS